MTQSLVNNVEENKDTAFDIMLKSVSKTSYKEQKENNFTNIMSNLSAKAEKAQTDFVDKAVKSNTSSINKKALDAPSKNSSSAKTDLKNAKKNTSIKNTETTDNTKTSKKIEKTNTNTNKVQNSEVSRNEKSTKNTKNTIKEELKNNDNIKNNIETNPEESNEVSDTNIDSFVEPSPDFIDNNNEIQTNENTLENQVLDIIGAALDINLSAFQSKDEKVDTIVNEIMSTEDNLKTATDVIEISALSDNLGQKDKEELKQLLEKISSIKATNIKEENNNLSFENIQDTLKSSINETVDLISDASNLKEETTDDTVLVNQNNEITDENLLQNTNEAVSKIDNSKINNNQNKIDLISSLNNEDSKKETTAEIENNQENITVSDTKIEKADENNTEKNSIQIIKNTNAKLNIPKHNIENNSEYKNNELNINENDSQVEFQQNNDELVTDDKIAEDNTNSIKVQDNFKEDKTTKEASNKISTENLKKENVLSENTKTELNSLINEKTDEITKEESIVLAHNVNKILNQEETETNNFDSKQGQNTEISSSKTEDYSDNTSLENNNNNNFEYSYNDKQEPKENYKKENFEYSKTKFSENIQINKKEDNSNNETQQVKATGKTQNTAKLEENLQKAVFTQKLLDKMAVSVDSTSTSSSALTVADEVAKIAIEENGSINSTNLTGNILYDSTGHSFSIKNLSAVKSPESIFSQIQSKLESNNILNQIGEKLTDLKNSASQKLTMVLRPNDLGRLSIELLTNKDGLTTNILAQNSDVRAYIEKNIITLRNQLIDAGINVNNIQIKTVGESGFSSYNGNDRYGEQESNQNLENQNNSGYQEKNPRNQKHTSSELLAGFSNYDYSFTKDFSGILNKTMSYSV